MTKTPTQMVTFRPPIVTVLGHVDHGKTTLLDTIRKTRIAEKEYGGITQHIGAYQINLKIQNSKFKIEEKKITFIDTPGHEAFAKMRSRGANVADIAVLVVAGNDGVMPQTIESLTHIEKAKIPFIVAVNKIDLSEINLEKIKKQLSKLGVKLEEYGGETPLVPLSAKTGQGIEKLMEAILLLADLYQIKEDDPPNFKGVVIESTLSKSRGATATVLIRSGKISVGSEVIFDGEEFRVRQIINFLGENITSAGGSDPIEVLGWKTVPSVGSLLYKKGEDQGKESPKKELALEPQRPIAVSPVETLSLEKIKLILKADTFGSLEAILDLLSENEDLLVLGSGVGEITESDIFLAKTTGALVIGFQVKISDGITKLAEEEKVIIKTYSLIYELTKELTGVITAFREGNLVKILGEAKVLAIFNIKDQKVLGVKVIKGRIARGDQIKAVRGEKEIGRARIKTLRCGKEDINTTPQGTEAGLTLSQNLDILTGDSIISIG